MLSFLKKSDGKSEHTFKSRVQHFWTWYAQVGARFHATIEAKKSQSLTDEVSDKVDELIPGFAWVFGLGETENEHSFTLTGEGNLHHQLLAAYWHSQAPQLPGWRFYWSRQPGEIKGKQILIQDLKFDPLEFWLTPNINQEDEKVDLVVWHPLYNKIEQGMKWTILFLFLDEVLGELGTQQWIGEIKLNDQRLGEAIPLQELRPFIEKIKVESGWKKYTPGDSRIIYRLEEPKSFLRGDIVIGNTANGPLIEEYLSSEGELADPLANTGADYIYVSFPKSFLTKGKEVDERGKIEDRLEPVLTETKDGRLIGGALGSKNAYIDILIFDGSNSIHKIINTLSELKLPGGTSINYFAKEKRGFRIVL